MFRISIIVPVLNRPKNVAPLLKSFKENTPNGKADLTFITSSSCKEEIDEINKHQGFVKLAIAPDEIISWARRINWGVDFTSNYGDTESSWILGGADDVIFHPGWFEAAEEASQGFSGIIGTNDLGHPATISGSHTTHPIVSRDYIRDHGTMDEPGKLCHEGYIHNYVDAEFVHTAHKRGCWKHAVNCIIEHNHPSWNKGIWDDVYQKGQDNVNADRALWLKRKAQFNL